MGLFRSSVSVAAVNFRRWQKDLRTGLIFLFTALVVFSALKPFLQYGQASGTKCTPLLLTLLFNSNMVSVASPKTLVHLGLLALLCDAPFFYPITPYMILRSGRRGWWLGECLYIMQASFIYLVFLTAICFFSVLPVITFENDWGSVIYDMTFGSSTRSAGEIMMQYPHFSWPDAIFQYLYPAASYLYSFFTGWAAFCILGLVMYLGRLLKKNSILGVVLAGVLVFLDPVLNWLSVSGYGQRWMLAFNPVCWSSIRSLNLLDSRNFLSIPFVAGMYLLLLAVLLTAIRFCAGRVTIDFI